MDDNDRVKDIQIHIHIQNLEEENKYLKGLLDAAGIAYEFKSIKSPMEVDEAPTIKEEILTKDKVLFFYSMFKGRKDVYSLRSGKPSKKTGKKENRWKLIGIGKLKFPLSVT
jgi:hypothetical protein